MKYITKKVIRGEIRYYLQYQGYTKYLGSSLLSVSKKAFIDFFNRIAEKKQMNIPAEIREEFKYGSLDLLEKMKYKSVVLKHELFREDYNRLYDEFIRLFTYNSNRSEGSKTTKKEIDAFATRRIRAPKTKTDQEIFNSFLAFNFAVSDDMKWNLKSIKRLHALLLDGLDPLIAGKWKTEDNIVGNQLTTEYKKVPEAMKNLILWLKKEFRKKTYPPKLALQFYVKFEHIHPFLDGNGRVGRILLNALLHKFGYPPIVFFSENHQEHTSAIQQALEGRWTKMNKHFLMQVSKTNDSLFTKFLS